MFYMNKCICTTRAVFFHNKYTNNLHPEYNEETLGRAGNIFPVVDFLSSSESAFPFKVVTCRYRWPYWVRVNSTQPSWAGVLPGYQGSAATADRRRSQ